MIIGHGLLLATLFAAGPPEQRIDEMCGNYTLFVALNSLDAGLEEIDSLEESLGPPPRWGHSLADLTEAAQLHGFHTLGIHTTLENLSARTGRFACIAHLKHGHFVLIQRIDEEGVHIIDPPTTYTTPDYVWNVTWAGDALLISDQPLQPESEIVAIVDIEARSRTLRMVFWTATSVVVIVGVALWSWRSWTTSR
ncbi:MAG: hypothetical protein KDA80_05175 [Planctomycetaceae bacterium]|nr:hypothetical protein [Planctomycetaceae bacterium]